MKPSLLLSLSLLFFLSCQKEDLRVLPDATQEGRGTAGFRLEGQVWLPKASKLGPGTSVWATQYRTVGGYSLRVDCYRDSDQTNFYLFVPTIRQAGTFILNQRAGFPQAAYGAYIRSQEDPDHSFYTGPSATGTLTVTRFDTVARIVSGTFELTVEDSRRAETLQLTEGRFDVPF